MSRPALAAVQRIVETYVFMALQLTKEKIQGSLQSIAAPYYIVEDSGSAINYTAAVNLAITTFNADWGVATDYQLEELGKSTVRITVVYNLFQPPPLDDQPTGTIRNRFQFVAQPQYVTMALETVAALPASFVNPSNYVNIQTEGGFARILGMPVPTPPITHIKEYVFDGFISDAYARSLAQIVGRTNSDTFFGYPAGELFLASAVGQQTSNNQASISFGFSAAQQISVAYGALGTLQVPPHHIHWGLNGEEEVSFELQGQTAQKLQLPVPLMAFAQRIYETAAFAGLQLPDQSPQDLDLRELDTGKPTFDSDTSSFLPLANQVA